MTRVVDNYRAMGIVSEAETSPERAIATITSMLTGLKASSAPRRRVTLGESLIRTHGNARTSRLSANGWQTSASWRQITWWVVAGHTRQAAEFQRRDSTSEGKSHGR